MPLPATCASLFSTSTSLHPSLDHGSLVSHRQEGRLVRRAQGGLQGTDVAGAGAEQCAGPLHQGERRMPRRAGSSARPRAARPTLTLAHSAADAACQATEKCFAKCVPAPGTSLSSKEQACTERCVERYFEGEFAPLGQARGRCARHTPGRFLPRGRLADCAPHSIQPRLQRIRPPRRSHAGSRARRARLITRCRRGIIGRLCLVRAASEHASSLASARRAALGHGARSLCAGALQALLVRRKGSCQMRGLQCAHVSLRRSHTTS